jgi:uncharacterized protein involved in type VI secretion and phage assembly
MREDSLDRWRITTRSVAGATSMQSWDYQSMRTRPVEASTGADSDWPGLKSRDTPGAYGYSNRTQGQRIADNQLEALQVKKEEHIGAGTVRTFAAGTTFVLRGHAYLDRVENDDGRTFAITRVVHLAHNNLSAELRSAIAQALGHNNAPTFGNGHAMVYSLAPRLRSSRCTVIVSMQSVAPSRTEAAASTLMGQCCIPGRRSRGSKRQSSWVRQVQ